MRLGRKKKQVGWPRPHRSALVEAVRAAASRGNVARIEGSGIQGWLVVRGELCSERGRDEVELIQDNELRQEVYEELLELTPALFRTQGELQAARDVLRRDGWGEHLLPDARALEVLGKPLNRADRRARERRG